MRRQGGPDHTPGGFVACTAAELAWSSPWMDADAYRQLLGQSSEWYCRHLWRRLLVRHAGQERAERGDRLAMQRVAWMRLVDTFRRDAFEAIGHEAKCRRRVAMLERMLRRGGVCECRPYSAKTRARTVVQLAHARERLVGAEARLDALSQATPPAYRDYAAQAGAASVTTSPTSHQPTRRLHVVRPGDVS